MPAGTEYDAGAPTIEVCIYRGDLLLVRELCETEADAAALVEQWSDVQDVYVLIDDLSSRHGPGDILAPDELLTGDDGDHLIDPTSHPGPGTE